MASTQRLSATLTGRSCLVKGKPALTKSSFKELSAKDNELPQSINALFFSFKISTITYPQGAGIGVNGPLKSFSDWTGTLWLPDIIDGDPDPPSWTECRWSL